MIRILDDTQVLATLASDTTNGIGVIQNISGTVTEELNGLYEAQFTVAQTEKYFSELHVGGIVRISTSMGDQMFRIYKITKPINQVSTIYCEHISYDLTKVAVMPFSSTGASATCSAMNSNASANAFTLITNISNASSAFRLAYPRSFRECLGGYEGSLLDVFRGEYEYDNLEVKMLARRGSDNGVRISYGKNLTDFNQEENNASTYTSVVGYAIVNEVEYHGDIYHKVASAQPRVKIVDFSSSFDMTDTPTTQELTDLATAYANANDIEVPKVNITVGFVQLYQTEEYKNIAPLERVFLGDTVHVYFEKIGVEASSRVIKTVWDINQQRYESVQLGDTKANLNSLISDAVSVANTNVTKATSFIESELNQMASLIINGLGLHRTLVPTTDGGYRIYLHNKEDLASSDTQYVFTSAGFMVSTDYGQTWNAGFDSSGNAVLNSLATITLRALDIYGSRITFGDENDKYITAGVYTDSNDNAVGVSFDGSGYARFQPHEQFQVVNLDSSDDVLNDFTMAPESANSGGAQVSFTNYKADNTIANHMEMTAEKDGGDETCIGIYNYSNSDTKVMNQITLRSFTENNNDYTRTDLQNNRAGTSALESSGLHLFTTSLSNTARIDALEYARISASSEGVKSGATFFALSNTTEASTKINVARMLAYNYGWGVAGIGAGIVAQAEETANAIQMTVNGVGSTTSAITAELNSSGKLLLNGRTQFANASGTSASVTCGANNSGSTTVSITIPTGYKAIAVANVKSNGNVVPAYTSASVFGMTGSQTLAVWWENGTNSAKTCTFTVDLLCAVDV